MDYLELILIAIGLSFDTFAVSVTAGVLRSRIRFFEAVKVAIIMALFQGTLPILGYYTGSAFVETVKAYDHWIAFILLAILGARMIWAGMMVPEKDDNRDLTKMTVLFTLAMGTSIDAFAVGIGFAFLEVRIVLAAVIIGLVTFMSSMTAIRLGKAAGPRLGSRAEVAGGVILIIIGTKILIEHLMAS